MKIAIDAQLVSRSASYRSAGVSGYSLALLREFGRLGAAGESRHHFHAFVNDPELNLPGVSLHPSRLPLHMPPVRIAWEQVALPLLLANHGYDLVHGLVNVLPLAATSRSRRALGLPGVVTVHDLSFVRLPEVLPAAKRAYLTALCRASAQRSARIIAVSTQTADDLVGCFGISAARIVVVPNGVGGEFCPAPPEATQAFRDRKGLPNRFLLYLGTLEPRKNLEMLVRAYARWRKTCPEEGDVVLVLAGAKGWFYETIFAAVRELGMEEHVLFPGYIPSAELPDWYRAALAFVYPSRLEGFGLPVLEAMACGTPVVISRTPSLQDVADDAGLAADAENEAELADCLHQIVAQPALRAELGRRALARASLYSWGRTARETLAVYDAIAR